MNEYVICDHRGECLDSVCDHFGEHEQNHDCAVKCDQCDRGCVPVPEDLGPQQQVAANTADRGYRGDWTAEQFAARQVCMLVKKLDELDACFDSYGHHWRAHLEEAAGMARAVFDDSSMWDCIGNLKTEKAKLELADIQVVVFNLAQALSEITGEPFDVVQAAAEKSAADASGE